MGLNKDSLCWKCKTKRGAYYMHTLWECPMVFPLWRNVLEYVGAWSQRELGDKTVAPQLSKLAFRVLITGLITCARVILRCWKEPQTPTLKMMREQNQLNFRKRKQRKHF